MQANTHTLSSVMLSDFTSVFVCWEGRKTLLCELGKARSSHGALRVEDGSSVEEELTESNGISLTLHSLHIVQHPLHYSCSREQRSHICGLKESLYAVEPL